MRFADFVVACLALSLASGADAFIHSYPAVLPANYAAVDSSRFRSTELKLSKQFLFGAGKAKLTLVNKKDVDPVQDISDKEVRSLFDLWNDSLQTGSSTTVANRYSKDPILLPTVSDTPRTDFDSIKDYFDAFLLKKPCGTILKGKITKGVNWCQDAGIYEFSVGADDSKVKARYTFVYVFEEGEWKIAHHHSSVMPEGNSGDSPTFEVAEANTPEEETRILPLQDISDEEVRDLFELWNVYLQTGSSKLVAKRYSKDPILLPTVSDTPRTDFDSIKDYFDTFLLKKPCGTILESKITKGANWCQDAGIYEFNMGADGSKVKARYTFVYVFEDDEWKIAHHHSSVMPEGGNVASPTVSSSEAEPIETVAAVQTATQKPMKSTTEKTATDSKTDVESNIESGIENDSDSDIDTDIDTDSDTDSDSDTDTDSDTDVSDSKNDIEKSDTSGNGKNVKVLMKGLGKTANFALSSAKFALKLSGELVKEVDDSIQKTKKQREDGNGKRTAKVQQRGDDKGSLPLKEEEQGEQEG